MSHTSRAQGTPHLSVSPGRIVKLAPASGTHMGLALVEAVFADDVAVGTLEDVHPSPDVHADRALGQRLQRLVIHAVFVGPDFLPLFSATTWLGENERLRDRFW